MCGICGFVGFRNEVLIIKMSDLLCHRGPDESGLFISDKASFGHRRLSIIDLHGGRQPIYNEDKSLLLVCNGEIYNYRSLRELLIEKGHRFSTQTDSEVLLHLYEEYGTDCLKHLNGMFAFAIWDIKKERLLLSRDRLGIRQLYYMIDGNKIIFSSEFKSILQYEGCPVDIDFESLDKFLTFRYIPGPATIINKIKKLKPAHILIFEKGKVKMQQYWKLNMQELKIDEDMAVGEFEDLFKDSVRLRLMSDVPYGVYLSGGIDSSSILAAMKGFIKGPIKTFTIGFDAEFDELTESRHISDFFGTDHNQIVMKSRDLYLLPKILWHMDDPYGDVIILPMYLLSKLASERVKVILTGEGADELFGGYNFQKNMYLGYMFDKFLYSGIKRKLTTKVVKSIPVGILNRFFQYSSYLGQAGKDRLIRYLDTFDHLGKNYLSLTALFTKDEKRLLYSDHFRAVLSKIQSKFIEDEIKIFLENNEASNYFNNLLNLGFKNWLPDNVLFSQDKTAMANSIETRVPFLDYRLVEFACKLPVKFKLKNFNLDKYILRKTMRKFLPKMASKRKQAFRVPIESNFREDFDELINIYLTQKRIEKRGYFNYSYVKKLISERGNEMLVNMQVMALVMLEMWFEVFMDNNIEKFSEVKTL